MTEQNLNVNVIPGGVMPVVKLNQYDFGLEKLIFTVYDGASPFTMPTGGSVVIQGTKPDKTGFSYACTYSNNVVTADVAQQMTVLAGLVVTELVIKDSSMNRIASANFVLAIEPAALNDETIISDTDLPTIIAEATEQMQRAEAAAETAVEAVESIGDSVERAEAAATSAAADAESASDDASTASSAATTASAAASTATSAATSATTAATDAHGWADNNGDSGSSTYSATNNAYYWAMVASSAAGGGLRPLVVQTLPTTDISTSTMYFVPSSDPETQNLYDEYINLDGTVSGYELIGTTGIDLSAYMLKTGDSKDNTVTITSSDDSTVFNSGTLCGTDAWSSVAQMATGETHASLFGKISTMFKNIRTLAKVIGTTDISAIGTGTISNAISSLNSDLSELVATGTGATFSAQLTSLKSAYDALSDKKKSKAYLVVNGDGVYTNTRIPYGRFVQMSMNYTNKAVYINSLYLDTSEAKGVSNVNGTITNTDNGSSSVDKIELWA